MCLLQNCIQYQYFPALMEQVCGNYYVIKACYQQATHIISKSINWSLHT